MAEAGKLATYEASIEIDEAGNIYCVFNYEKDSVIEDLEAVSQGEVTKEEAVLFTFLF